jgi:hypothetical protein
MKLYLKFLRGNCSSQKDAKDAKMQLPKLPRLPKIAGNDVRGRVMFGNSGASGN